MYSPLCTPRGDARSLTISAQILLRHTGALFAFYVQKRERPNP